ncbi:hypothetical protein ALO62_102768 [Pseudomonas amygdali pv. myricae]|nr:hypothetical protein ALO62_102768 [Pseudomonas amygdali pv. myricae]
MHNTNAPSRPASSGRRYPGCVFFIGLGMARSVFEGDAEFQELYFHAA